MLYSISRNGQTFGPYTSEDVQRYLTSGNILPTDLAQAVPAEGDDASAQGWLPVAQLFGGAPLASQPGMPASAAYNPYVNAVPGALDDHAERFGIYPYFPVSTLKFCVMSFVTVGLYQVYWAYKQWVRIQGETGEKMMPWARALFLGIWNFALFSRVHDQAAAEEIPAGWNHIVLGVLVLLFSIASRAPGIIGGIVFFSFLAYLPVIKTIEQINRKRADQVSESPNDRFTGWNIAGIVVGGLFLALAVVGLLVQTFQK